MKIQTIIDALAASQLPFGGNGSSDDREEAEEISVDELLSQLPFGGNGSSDPKVWKLRKATITFCRNCLSAGTGLPTN